MLGAGLEPTQEDLDLANVAIKLSSDLLLPRLTIVRLVFPSDHCADPNVNDLRRVEYHGEGGLWTIMVLVDDDYLPTGSARIYMKTAKLYEVCTIVRLPRSTPALEYWKRVGPPTGAPFPKG
jgi:hypothetical protein